MSPAPWTYDINKDRSRALIVDAEGFTVAYCLRTGPTNIEPDTQLMTAAPDMLDALQRAREVLLWNLGDDSRIDAAFDAVTAAINKATYTKEQTA
jgi:hypothetical protein